MCLNIKTICTQRLDMRFVLRGVWGEVRVEGVYVGVGGIVKYENHEVLQILARVDSKRKLIHFIAN